MKGKHEKNSGWRKLLVLSLAVMMAVMFMPASALADGTDGGTQPAASSSQSVDKGSTGTGDTGSEAVEQKTEEKEVNQGAADAVQPSSEQQDQLSTADTGSETEKESSENSDSDVPENVKTQLKNERRVAFDSDYYEACIGEKKYETIGDALRAAKDGDTVTLLRDIDRDFEIAAFSKTDQTKTVRSIDKGGIDIPSGKNITLNLNAHQVMTSPENGHKYSIKVASGSTVRIVNQPTSARQAKLGTIDSNDVQETQREVKGEAVLSSGIINEGTVTLDNTQGKIYLNNDNGYSFYNSGSLILQGDYSTGYPPALSWLRLTLNIIEQTKDAKVLFADGFDADRLSFQLPDEVLSELNNGTMEDDYTVVEAGGDTVKALMDKDYSSNAHYHVTGLTNSRVSLDQSKDKIVLRCLKTAIYLDPKYGKITNDGTSSDQAVKTLEQALKLYNESNGSVEIHVLNTVNVTSDTTLPKVEGISDSEGKKADGKRICFVREDSFKGTLFHVSGQGELNLSNVTVDGKNISATGPLIWVSNGGKLILDDGAVLKNNKNNANGIACGGAVYAEGENTRVNMNGGEIRSCRAVWGGGIFLRDASLTMNGGTISDNTASDYLDTSTDSTSSTEKETKDEKDQLGTGGGVCIAYNAVMNMSGGTVSGNTARRGGGVSAGVDQSAVLKDTEDNHRAFTMSGGTISDNTAAKEGSYNLNVTGGGIYVACRNVAEITAGTISGNRVNNAMGYAGGGIYVNGGAAAVEDENGKLYSNGVLKTQNVYFSGNRDGGNGAAIAVCPTSRLKLYYDGNVVIDPAGNDIPDLYIQYTTDGRHQAQKDENGVPYVGYYLSSIMQDGSPYNWTEKAGRSFETDTNAKLTKEALQLEAHPSADAVNRNKASCKVFITGNSVAENGGGIAANGDLEFGSTTTPPTPTPTPTPTPSPTYRHVTVQKTWTLDDGKTRPDSIQVQLMKNGVAYGSPVTLNDANSWTFTWNNLENDGSQWTVNEVLVPQGFTESQKTTEESDGLKVVINNDDQPTKPNKPTNPTKPNKPTNPKTPGKTNKTVNPKTPGKTNTSVTPKTPMIHRAATHNTSVAPASSVPRTSDATRLGTMLIMFGGAAAALAAVLALKRKDKE